MNDTLTADLQARLAATENQIAELDFDAARARIKRADEQVQTLRGDAGALHLIESQELQHARGEAKQARIALSSLEGRQTKLQAEAANLRRLLTAQQAVDKAVPPIAVAEGRVEAAAEALRQAEATVARLDALIDEETTAAQAAVLTDGAAMLEAVKAGGNALAAVPTRADKVQPLKIARATADEERAQAERALKIERDALSKLRLQLRTAEATVAELDFLAARAAFVQAAGRYKAARVRAKQGGWRAPDLDGEANAAMVADFAANGDQ
ncbi:hypothetical protein [Rubrivivax albus]|uniref:Uncharacterized protein n=1 Tax=Rubrivivax albus TaxID=2499835 RepID=A0A437JNJ0_9BURK|nr:hypothetical protein [Rubrivivax albus]RVT48390.1 hypothetical protein ENE75_22095 [Rubrivivax albus]